MPDDKKARPTAPDYEAMSKEELQVRAHALGVKGSSKMSKRQLISALRRR